jgi:hypothetical protein
MKKFRFDEDGDVVEDIRSKYGFDGDLLDIYATNEGASVHKWHHYIPLYDRYFERFRGTPVRFLEIGVNKGGSMQMWRRYFGDKAVIYGIDVRPDCAEFDGKAGQVRIGSQADPDFLSRVVDEMGGVDVVLDDGSHKMKHIKASLRALFPRLSNGGVYMIEDLHTAYFPKYGGGYGKGGSFFNMLRRMMDDMHRWYHHKGLQFPEMGGAFSAFHIHDSMVIIEKDEIHRPVHSWVK